MNQVQKRMNNTSGMVVEFPPSEEPRDVTPLVASKLDELHLQLVAKDAIVKCLVETIQKVRDEICDRNQYCFWRKQVDMMDNAILISKGKLP